MKYDIKYIYFELYSEPVVGEETKKAEIQNENALMFKPNTNSSGIWGFTSLTKSYRYKTRELHTHIQQFWIDFEKYETYTHDGGIFDNIIQEVLNKLNINLRKFKLEKLEKKKSDK